MIAVTQCDYHIAEQNSNQLQPAGELQRLIVSIAIKTSSLAINLPSDAHMIYVRDGATLLRLESGNDAAARAVNGMR